jgi:hypothetical protein
VGITMVLIYDLQNTLRITKKYENAKQATLSLGSLPPGTYVVKVSDGLGTESQQIIMQ